MGSLFFPSPLPSRSLHRQYTDIKDLCSSSNSNATVPLLGGPSAQSTYGYQRLISIRQVYLKHPDGDFWDQLDDRLDEIRNEAKNEAKKLTRGFHHVLTHDQDKHGAKDYVLDETTVDDFQQQVDDIIAVDTATSTGSVQDSTA
ncbi:hypothetical protein B0H14DRAFT_3550090 [Mycena olivaceomarginata]|nr:hypothetical protein B0H14DRAFT_3550090 [Mycena olivaceomarginata]